MFKRMSTVARLAVLILCVLATARAQAVEWLSDNRPADRLPARWLESGECGDIGPVTFSADVLALSRSGVDPQNVLFNVVSGAPALSTSDLDIDISLSGRFDLIFYGNSGTDLEFALLGFPEVNESDEVRSTPDTLTFLWFNAAPATPATSYTVEYQSRLKSGEINFRHRTWPWLTVVTGFRYVGLHEDFNIVDTATIGTGTEEGVYSSTKNDLFGVQVGGEFVVATGRIGRLVVLGKSGYFYNAHKVYALAGDGVGGSIIMQRSDRRASVVSEASVMLELPVWGPGSIRAGYQAYWLNDVILATDQSDNFAILTSAGSFDLASPTYHGGFVGLEFWF